MRLPKNITLTSIAIAAAGLTVWATSPRVTASAPDEPAANDARSSAAPSGGPQTSIARGEHLVTTAACHDCHTPLKLGAHGPEPDMTRALSGHPESIVLPPAPAATPPWVMSASATNTAWSGPWGTSFTANLTPDKETGLGTWSKATFIQTIRSGRHMGRGRPILPPMPIPAYRNFSDDELGAIFDYLQSLPALKNRVPAPLPPPASPSHKG